MKAQWIVLIVAGSVVVLGLIAWLLLGKGPDLSPYLPLKEPRIVRRAEERVLELKFSGPAETVIQQAFAGLFKSYYGLKGSPKGPGMRPPKARYQLPAADDPRAAEKLGGFLAHDWTGSVAIPIPAGLAVPAQPLGAEGMAAAEGVWGYGEVAEILHLGSYETEPPTIERLMRFIEAEGYKVIGDHEEEYLRGPGDRRAEPKDYWTIIRYRVEKVR